MEMRVWQEGRRGVESEGESAVHNQVFGEVSCQTQNHEAGGGSVLGNDEFRCCLTPGTRERKGGREKGKEGAAILFFFFYCHIT